MAIKHNRISNKCAGFGLIRLGGCSTLCHLPFALLAIDIQTTSTFWKACSLCFVSNSCLRYIFYIMEVIPLQ